MNENFKAPLYVWSRDNSDGMAIIYGLEAWVSKSCDAKTSLSTKQYRPALKPTQSVIQWMPWSYLGGKAKRLGCDVDCSPPFTAKSKNE
jgi:hypothetical protein